MGKVKLAFLRLESVDWPLGWPFPAQAGHQFARAFNSFQNGGVKSCSGGSGGKRRHRHERVELKQTALISR